MGRVAVGLLGFSLVLAVVRAYGVHVGATLQWSLPVLVLLSLAVVGWHVLLDDVDRRVILAWVRKKW